MSVIFWLALAALIAIPVGSAVYGWWWSRRGPPD